MSLPGVSTRKAAAMTEEPCGTSLSQSQVSALVGRLDSELAAWRTCPLTTVASLYLTADARYAQARGKRRGITAGMPIVAGVRDDGRREILAV
jgi:putative transposase